MTDAPPPGYPPPGYGPQPGQPYGPPQEDTVWSVLVHLSLFVFGLLAPLVMFLVVKDDRTKPMTRHHAVEALNFHISLAVYGVGAAVLFVAGMVVTSAPVVLIVAALLVVGYITAMVLAVVAAIAAGKRQPYRYPLTIRFVR